VPLGRGQLSGLRADLESRKGRRLDEMRVPRLKLADGGHSHCTELTLSSSIRPDWSCWGDRSQMNLDILRSCDLCGSDRIMVLDAGNNICKCGSCGYVFDNPRPTAEEVAIFYSKPGKYDPWVREEEARDSLWMRRLRKMEKTKKPGSLLDIGTGAGQFLHHARSHYSPVCGSEVSQSGAELAKKKYGLCVRQGDVATLDFPEAPFDNITLFHVLEHVPSPKVLIRRCAELLKPGGRLVVAVPNDLLYLRAKVKILLKGLGVRRYRHLGELGLARITLDGSMQEIHVSHFTAGVLRRLLENSGFSILEDSIDPYYAATGIAKLMQDLEHAVYRVLLFAGQIRLYPAIWMVARKESV